MENRKVRKLLCACSNCKNSSYCIGQVSCYRLIDKEKCPQNNCFGCFNNFIQAFQCDYKSKNMQVTCCNQTNFCNLNLTHKIWEQPKYFQIESNSSNLFKINLFVIAFILLLILGISWFGIYLFK